VAIGNENKIHNEQNITTNINGIDLCEKKPCGSLFKFIAFDLLGMVASIVTLIAFLFPNLSSEENIGTAVVAIITKNSGCFWQ
jgi:hypothetical protein